MRNALIVSIALLVVLAAVAPATAAGATIQEDPECEYPLESTDATGVELTLEEPPDRVVALMPSDAQTTFEIGAEDRVVGMPIGPATDHLETDGQEDITEDDGFTVDVETVVGLEPDVVVAANASNPETVEQLRELGVDVYQFHEADSLDDVRENVVIAGQLTGECEGAEATTAWMDERLELFESALEDEDHPLAYYEMGDGWTAGTDTFQHELLTAGGLENVAERAGIESWEIISEEAVVDEDPEWIVYGDTWPEPPVAESLQETTAYQEENFVVVDNNFFSQPAPMVVVAIEEIVETVHPDAYDAIADDLEELDERYEAGELLEETDETDDEPETTNDETDDEPETANDEADERDDADESDDGNGDGTADDETDDPVSGFGVAVTVVAVLAAIGASIHRRSLG